MKKQNRGITLVALVITIIILLILAGLTISALTGSGLFGKAGEAVDKYGNAQNRENLELSKYEDYINGYINGTRDTITIDKTEYEGMKSTLSAVTTKLQELEENYNTLLTKSNIETGTYIGTGTYGSANKNSITFSKAPKLVYLTAKDGYDYQGEQVGSMRIIAGGASIDSSMPYSFFRDGKSGVGTPIHINWSNDGKSMNWYSETNKWQQYNSEDTEYTWIAFYD